MAKHNILFVEDSIETQMIVRQIFKSKYDLTVVGTATEALKEISTNTFSLIILDIELPDGDGYKICSQSRLSEKNSTTPVIFLSGKGQIDDKVMGLSVGADDYLVKPIEPKEFQARVDARIRRQEETSANQENFSIGPFRVITSQQKVYATKDKMEVSVDLTPIEFKLFCFLMRHEDQTVTRAQLLTAAWGNNVNVGDRTVDSHIYTLRQKLGNYSLCVQSVHGQGYRFSHSRMSSAA